MADSKINDYNEINAEYCIKLQKLDAELSKSRKLVKKQDIKSQIDDIESELIKVNDGFLKKLARKYNKTTEFDDAYQYASIELLKAARNYDPNSGFKFITFAGTYIKNNICMREIQRNYKSRFKIRFYKALDELEKAGNYSPTYDEIAKQMGMKPVDFAMYYNNLTTLSLDDMVANKNSDKGNQLEFADTIKDETCDVIETAINREQHEHIIRAMYLKLSEREFQIVYGHFFYGMTQSALAKMHHLTRERVRQIILASLRKIKPYLKMNIGSNFKNEDFKL